MYQENVYVRLSRELLALAEYLKSSSATPYKAGDYADGLARKYDFGVMMRALDVMALGLVDELDHEGCRGVRCTSVYPANEKREHVLISIDRLLAAIGQSTSRVPPPLKLQADQLAVLATDLLAATEEERKLISATTAETDDGKWCTNAEAAEILGVTASAVTKFVQKGRLLSTGYRHTSRVNVASLMKLWRERLNEQQGMESTHAVEAKFRRAERKRPKR